MSHGLLQRVARPLLRYLAAGLDPLARRWWLVFGGNVARLVLGFFSSVVIARALGPASFGLYGVLGVISNIVNVISDLGLTGAAVRQIAPSWQQDPTRARQLGQIFFWLRVGAITLVGGVLALFSAPLSRLLLGPAAQHWLLLALLGVAAMTLSGAANALLQATGRFAGLALVTLTNAALTVVLALLLALAGWLGLASAILVLGSATSIAGFLVGLWLLPRPWPLGWPGWRRLRSQAGPLLRFGRWLWLSNVLAVLAAYLDVLLVHRWVAPALVGTYTLALGLASKVEIVNHSLYTVLLPTASSLTTQQASAAYLRRGLVRSMLLSLPLLLLIPLAGPLIALVYGPAYLPAALLLQGLLCVASFEIFTTPLLMLPYTFNRPGLLAATDGLRVIALVVLAAWLIPLAGPFGAVLARFGARLLGVVLLVVLLRQPGPPGGGAGSLTR